MKWRSGTFTVLGLDPGGTTGWWTWVGGIVFGPDGPWFDKVAHTAGELTDKPHYMLLEGLVGQARSDNYVIVCEQFDYRSQKSHATLISKEYIGIVERQVLEWNDPDRVELVMQSPALKTFWNNGKLQKMGMYSAGKTHANDACRHALYYLAFKFPYANQLKLLDSLR
jgi:hypothetical protein